MRRVPVRMESQLGAADSPLHTAVVGPTGAALDEVASLDTPVVVMLHGFDR